MYRQSFNPNARVKFILCSLSPDTFEKWLLIWQLLQCAGVSHNVLDSLILCSVWWQTQDLVHTESQNDSGEITVFERRTKNSGV